MTKELGYIEGLAKIQEHLRILETTPLGEIRKFSIDSIKRHLNGLDRNLDYMRDSDNEARVDEIKYKLPHGRGDALIEYCKDPENAHYVEACLIGVLETCLKNIDYSKGIVRGR